MRKYLNKTITPLLVLILLLFALLAAVYLVKTQQQDIRNRAAPPATVPSPTPTFAPKERFE